MSLRGQTELALIEQYKSADEFDPDKEDFPTTHEFLVDEICRDADRRQMERGGEPSDASSAPPADFRQPASIDRGKQVFFSNGGCVKCHGPTELGDGQQVYDMWNEPIDKLHIQLADRERVGRSAGDARAKKCKMLRSCQTRLDDDALPPRESEPRNLRQGIFRGGRQPYEIFYRAAQWHLPSQYAGHRHATTA